MLGSITFYSKRDEIEKDCGLIGEYRKEKQDMKHPSAGSIFKNPSKGIFSAGELIDQCGLKGYTIGGAMISVKHANFIVNTSRASAKDVLALIGLARAQVKEKFSIDLELELKLVP